MNVLKVKKCNNCGAVVEIIEDCTCGNCGIACCGKEMSDIVANTVDCAIEKHKPQFVKNGQEIEVKVNHVMEEGHFIEFIALVYGDKIFKQRLNSNQDAFAVFPYISGSTLYAYCNKHGLWSTDVD